MAEAVLKRNRTFFYRQTWKIINAEEDVFLCCKGPRGRIVKAHARVFFGLAVFLIMCALLAQFRVQFATSDADGVTLVGSQGLGESSRCAKSANEGFTVEDTSTAAMDGMTVNAWSAEAYNSSDFDQSIANLASLNVNWVTFTVFWFMNTSSDTIMGPRPDLYTASDSSLEHAIQKAHGLNMQVALKPMVDVLDGAWRGSISPSNWTLWFANYASFIDYYANLSRANGVELFVVGCELRSSQSYVSNWRQVISGVRALFSGNLTYAANWDSYSVYSKVPSYGWEPVTFWDALDYVGVDAYFPLTNSYNPTVEQLVGNWSQSGASGWWGTGFNWTNELYATYANTGKKIIFTEIGYTSQNGTNTQPWTYVPPPTGIDLQEQADCYQACLEVFKDKTWFMGWFWWEWRTDPNAGGPNDTDYTPQNKPAQSILYQYYSPTTITFQAAGTSVPVTVNYTRVTGNYTAAGSLTVPIASANSTIVPCGSNISFSYESIVAGTDGTQYLLVDTNPASPLTNVVNNITVLANYVNISDSGGGAGRMPYLN